MTKRGEFVRDVTKDRNIMVSEVRKLSAPAYHVRSWLEGCGITIRYDEGQGPSMTVQCNEGGFLEVGQMEFSTGLLDPALQLGLDAPESRNYTSALAWAVARLRLAPGMENLATSYAAIWLCRQEDLIASPLLPDILAGQGGALELLAEELLVAPWCVAEAIMVYGLSDRVLCSIPSAAVPPQNPEREAPL